MTLSTTIKAALSSAPDGVVRREVTFSARPSGDYPADVRIRVVDRLPSGDSRTTEFATDRYALDEPDVADAVLGVVVADHARRLLT